MRKGRAFVTVVLAVSFIAVRGWSAGPPRDLEDYVLLGIESAKIGNQAFIDSGDVGINNAASSDSRNAGLSCGKHVFINEAAVAAQTKMSDGSSVCDLFTKDLVSSLDNVTIRCSGPTDFSPRHSAGVSIRDDGRGLQPAESRGRRWGGLGLALMRKRVEDIGGRFSIQSIPGKGTRIAASIPCLS
jgi:hypothetical protein